MSSEVAGLRTSIATLVAAQMLFSTVSEHVSFKGASLGTFVVALVAFIRFFSSMGKNVSLEVAGKGTFVAALVAFERLRSSMNRHVLFHFRCSEAREFTLLASITFLSCVSFHVCSEAFSM